MAPRPQNPGYLVLGMTTNVAPTTTNEFRFNYTRNFWQWGSANAPPQLPGLGGAVEIASGYSNSTAESSTCANTLIPYNVGTQCTRQRFWDGQDKLVRDDLTMIKGNHLFQFGGTYQRNYDYHMRTDNGSGINDQIVYQIASSNINFTNSPWIPASVPSSQQTNLSKPLLGGAGPGQPAPGGLHALREQPHRQPGRPAGLRSEHHPVLQRVLQRHVAHEAHVHPDLQPGLGAGNAAVRDQRQAGDGGDVGRPTRSTRRITWPNGRRRPWRDRSTTRSWGLRPCATSAHGLKYPFLPFYGAFSPRVSGAWNPKFDSGILGKLFGNGKTVLRGGYGRIYGRLNGVNLVLVPLLGIGPLQPVTCAGPNMNGTCAGANNVDPTNVFRIGTDGMTAPLPTPSQTLAQPFFMGYNGAATAGDVNTLDPHYRPERTDNFSFSIQRELRSNMMLDVGYIGRIIRNEMQELNLDDVPYMTTLNGQSFAQAYAAVYSAMIFTGVAPGLGAGAAVLRSGPGRGELQPTARVMRSCTAAVASKLTSNFKTTAVSDIWAALNKASSWTLGRTMISGAGNGVATLQATSLALTTSMGFGNYNAHVRHLESDRLPRR